MMNHFIPNLNKANSIRVAGKLATGFEAVKRGPYFHPHVAETCNISREDCGKFASKDCFSHGQLIKITANLKKALYTPLC